MLRSRRSVARYAAALTVIFALATIVSPSMHGNTPYGSALSITAAGPVLAAGHCNDRACGASFKCERALGFNCLGRCQTHQCF